MFELILALIQAAPSTSVPPQPDTVVVTGRRPDQAPVDAVVDMPADDTVNGEYVAIWPASAYQSRSDGKVILSCLVDVHGLAEQCRVASETPSGKGFGAAALQMRPTFKLKPATGPEGPVNATMNIAVAFTAPLSDFDNKNQFYRGNPLAMRDVTMVNRPVWVAAPTVEDWERAYPAGAHNVEGYVVAHCRVLASGALTECGAVKELPQAQGFAAAAKSLTSRFRLDPALAVKARTSSLWVDLPIRMAPPGAGRRVDAPSWLVGVDPAATPKLYPPEAAAKGVPSGHGVAVCEVGPDGGMKSCAADQAASDSPGFAEAAMKVASAMKMNLWSADAAPVVGGKVRIGVRLNLKDAQGS